MSGFGYGFGYIPFGGATLTATPLLLVQLSANLLAAPAFFSTDQDAALSARNWSIIPLDPDAHERLVQSVQSVTPDNAAGFNLPQLVLVELPITLLAIDGVLTYGKRYRVTYNGESFDFEALKASPTAAPADVRTDDGFIWDLANPYLSRDALVLPPQLGTYQVTDAGDLGIDKSGEASLRKRITRRVTSATSSFFHLSGYGVGVQVKRLVSIDMLRRLSARIRAQVKQEPEVREATCRLTQDRADTSVIWCSIDAQTGASAVQIVVPVRLP